MRRIGLALLAASAGCNQLFGIKDTDQQPDAPPLTYTGKMQWAAAGATDGQTDVFPIGNEAVDGTPPTLQVGPMLGAGDLVDAPYDTATGEFHFGFMLAGQPWRLVYTLPGDTVTHELQWTVQAPDLVVPRMTRKGLMPPPAGSGYHVQPTPATTFNVPMVSTGGAFTSSLAAPGDYLNNDMMYPFPERATPLEGPLAAPSASDWVLITDFTPITTDLLQVVGWGIANVSLTAGALTPVAPTWQPGPLLTIRPVPALGASKTRLAAALNALGNDDSTGQPLAYLQHMNYGLTPNSAIYGFAPGAPDCGGTPASADLAGIDCLGAPAIVRLVDDKRFDTSVQIPQIDQTMVPIRPVMYARVSQARAVHGVTLTSALQSLVLAPSTPQDQETIDVLSTSVATAVFVDQIKLDSADLSGATGPVTPDVDVTAATGPRTLTFHPRIGVDNAPLARADDFVITLYEIKDADTATAKLHTVRVYHLIDYSAGVKIDGALLPAGLYVFAITARVGYQNASAGDFRTVTYPLGESTVFSRQFAVH